MAPNNASSVVRNEIRRGSGGEGSSGGCTVAIPAGTAYDALSRHVIELGFAVYRHGSAGSENGEISLERWMNELMGGEFDDVVFCTAQGVRLLYEFSAQRG